MLESLSILQNVTFIEFKKQQYFFNNYLKFSLLCFSVRNQKAVLNPLNTRS